MHFAVGFREELTKAWENSRSLTVVTFLMLAAFVLPLLGMVIDPRTTLGSPLWLKPAKFGISSAIYAGTLAWLFQYIRVWRRTVGVLGFLTALALVIEVAIIDWQAGRGTTSHFNISSPADAAMWRVMATTILVLWLASVGIAAALLRQPFANRAFGYSLRLGMIMTVIGSASGGLMVTPTTEQKTFIAEKHQAPPSVGGHTIGAKDGGPGLPGVGWSSRHGDLRIPHFLGLHALQIIPLAYWLLVRRRRSSYQAVQIRQVFAIAASYLGLFIVLVWQALRGQSIVEPDGITAFAFATWIAVSVALILIPRAGMRQSRTNAISMV